ncbi:MAG TPA: MerR family transcriptional regulator [Gemmata sp.]|nr:MerR family transcriptional regulator [Gemmata sp.]
MPEQTWKVGELARRTGLTVRTLHHYDAIGLLSPSGRTGSAHGSGHRLYTAADLARLHQILCLRQLGFGLEQIREYMSRGDYDPREVVRLHLAEVRRKAAELAELGDRIQGLYALLDRADAVSPETFLQTIEAVTMVEKYYTPEQLKQLEERKAQVGDARIQEVQAEWPRLMAEVQAAMDAGVPATDPKAQEFARRWFGLVSEFTGGDPGIFRSLRKMYQTEDTVAGMDVKGMRPMQEYIEQARVAAGITLPGE